MSLPANVSTGLVTGRFLVGVTDGPDQDQDPDGIAATGTVTFTAAVPYLADPTASTVILNTKVFGVLDVEGYLCTPVQGTLDPAYRGVRLIATDDPDVSNQGWTWNVSYQFGKVNKETLTIPGHGLAVLSNGAVDLSTAVTVPSSPGLGTEQAEALTASAQAAAVTSANEAAAAAVSASNAAAAAQATDGNVAGLVTGPGQTRDAVDSITAAAVAPKLNSDTAAGTYQTITGLPASIAAQVSTNGTNTNTAVKAIADAAAAPKLDSATAATTYAAKSVETSKLDASQKGAASGVATLDAASKVPTAQVPAGLPVDQYDYVQAIAARSKYTKMQLKKVNSTNEVEVSCLTASGNHVTYQFYGNAAGDDYRVLANIWTGTSTATTSQVVKKVWADGTPTGTYSTLTVGQFIYTTDKVTPATFTTTFVVDVDGSDVRFHTYRDNRGGSWEVKITGPSSVTVNVSTYAASAAYNTAGATVLTNLRPGTYTAALKFLGDDPLNVPSTGAGTARGWLTNFDSAANSASAVMFDVYAPFRQINKDTLVKPASNMDFAMEVKPAGGPTLEYIPYHGTATAFQADAPVYLDGDAVIDLAGMASGQYRALAGFELVQRVYGRNASSGATNLIDVATSQTIRPTGQVTVNGRWKALADIELGDNYVMMLPASMAVFDRLVSSIGNGYANNAGLIGTVTALAAENDTAAGYLFLSSTNKAIVAAARFNNPLETIRRGKTSKPADALKAFLQHRDSSIVKVYNRPYSAGTAIPAGTVHRFGGDYIYAALTGAYDQYTI